MLDRYIVSRISECIESTHPYALPRLTTPDLPQVLAVSYSNKASRQRGKQTPPSSAELGKSKHGAKSSRASQTQVEDVGSSGNPGHGRSSKKRKTEAQPGDSYEAQPHRITPVSYL